MSTTTTTDYQATEKKAAKLSEQWDDALWRVEQYKAEQARIGRTSGNVRGLRCALRDLSVARSHYFQLMTEAES